MTRNNKHVVAGGGSGGMCMAADLALAGQDVVLWEHPAFAESPSFRRVAAEREIVMSGIVSGRAPIPLATTDAAEALAGATFVHVVVPSNAHDALFEALIPSLTADHTVVVWAGNYGSLRLRHLLVAARREETMPHILEGHTLPYGARLDPSSGHVLYLCRAPLVWIASAAGRSADDVVAELQAVYDPKRTRFEARRSVLEVALSNPNPIIHPAGSLLNTGRIEYAKGTFHLYREGITRAVAGVIRDIQRETSNVARAYGLSVLEYEDREFQATTSFMGYAFRAAFDTVGVIANIAGPKTLQDRYITEDVPFGLVPTARLARLAGVSTPLIDAMVHIGSSVCEQDFWGEGRSLEALGLPTTSVDALRVAVRGADPHVGTVARSLTNGSQTTD